MRVENHQQRKSRKLDVQWNPENNYLISSRPFSPRISHFAILFITDSIIVSARVRAKKKDKEMRDVGKEDMEERNGENALSHKRKVAFNSKTREK